MKTGRQTRSEKADVNGLGRRARSRETKVSEELEKR